MIDQLNLCRQARDGLRAIDTLAETVDNANDLESVMAIIGFDDKDIQDILFQVNFKKLAGLFDEDVCLD